MIEDVIAADAIRKGTAWAKDGMTCSAGRKSVFREKRRRENKGWVVVGLHEIYFYEEGCNVLYMTIVRLCRYSYFANAWLRIATVILVSSAISYVVYCMRYGMQFWSEGLTVCHSVCHIGAKAKERV